MMRNLTILGCALLLAIGLSLVSTAGSIIDADGDGVPDQYDNCTTVSNGPLTPLGCNGQEDEGSLTSVLAPAGTVKKDGFGVACDTDLNDDGATGLNDVGETLNRLGSTVNPEADYNCDGAVGLNDVGKALNDLGFVIAGSSGLACAGVGPFPCVAP